VVVVLVQVGGWGAIPAMRDALSAQFPVDSVVPDDRLHDWRQRYGATLATEPMEVLRRAPAGYYWSTERGRDRVVLWPNDAAYGNPYFVTSVAGSQQASLFFWYGTVAFTLVPETKRERGSHWRQARWL
jgi:hypothetical protein